MNHRTMKNESKKAWGNIGENGQHMCLVDEGEKDITVLGPFATEQLDELLFTLSSPLKHLKSTNNVESNTSNGETSKDVEAEPGHDFTEVIGASDVLKETAVRDDEIVGSLRTHVLETHVANEVEDHEAAEPGEANQNVPEGKLGCCGDVNVVSNSSSERPIISTVLEQVEDGHGKSTKFVNENGLKNTLGIVDHPEEECNLLCGVKRSISLVTIHRENTQSKETIDKPWTSIFKEVHRKESNLWAQIFESNFN